MLRTCVSFIQTMALNIFYANYTYATPLDYLHVLEGHKNINILFLQFTTP